MIEDDDDPGDPIQEGKPWTVEINRSGDTIHVSPSRGWLEIRNWTWSFPIRWFPWSWVGHYRLEWPKNERQLKRSVLLCQQFCDRENAREARARMLVP